MGLTVDPHHLTARPGRVLVRRLDPGATARRVIVPAEYRANRVSCSAVVERVGAGCPAWAVEGIQVILAPHRGKTLHIGQRNEVEWESIPPAYIQAVVCGSREGSAGESEPVTPSVQRDPESVFRSIPPDERVPVADIRDEEGT